MSAFSACKGLESFNLTFSTVEKGKGRVTNGLALLLCQYDAEQRQGAIEYVQNVASGIVARGGTDSSRREAAIKLCKVTARTTVFGQIAEVEPIGWLRLEYVHHPVHGDAHIAYSGGFTYYNFRVETEHIAD